MKLAIAIFRYFPYGGLQRDMRFIAEEAIKRGHQVTIFCGEWQGEKLTGADIRICNQFVWFNIAGVRRFIKAFEKQFDRKEFDLLLGFNKMPGLDIYFAGDTCFAEKAFNRRNWSYRLTPRARLYLAYERAVFSQQSNTFILSLVDTQENLFNKFYATPQNRFHSLPPGIVPEHIACADPEAARQSLLARFSLTSEAKILVCLGSDFHRKGVDISIEVFAAIQKVFPQSILLIVGQDNEEEYQQQAARLGVADNVIFMGASDQVGELLHAADALLHLAREELAGNVILEAMLSGCPVLVSAVCGYAKYVSRYNMGKLVESLADTSAISQSLTEILRIEKTYWKETATLFYESGEAFSRIAVLMKYLEHNKNESCNKTQQIKIEDWRNLQVDSSNEHFFHFVQNLQGDVVRKMPDREALRFICDDKAYYVKRHFGVGWKEIIKNLLQIKLPVLGASNEWCALKRLEHYAIPSLQPVTYGVKGRNPARQVSFIVTDELKDVVQLDHFLESHSLNIQQKVSLIQKAADIVREMHRAGINHRDLYLCHFMLKKHWSVGQPDIYIIDLHRAQIRKKIPLRWLIKDLAALYFSSMSLPISSRDRLRFLRRYYQLSLPLIYKDNAKFIKRISKRAEKLFNRHS